MSAEFNHTDAGSSGPDGSPDLPAETFRLLAQESPVSMMAFDRDGRITFVNRWHLNRLAHPGQDASFFIGRRLTELPDIAQAGIASDLARILNGETVILRKVHFPASAEGQSTCQNIRGVPVYSDGVLSGGILIREDVTGQDRSAEEQKDRHRESEQNLRQQKELLQSIMDNIPIMIAILNLDIHYIWVNRSWETTLGWSLEETRGRNIIEELYPEPEERTRVEAHIKNSSREWGRFRPRTRSGRVIDTSWLNVKLSGGVRIGIGVDVTEQVEAAEKQRKLEEQLIQSQKMEAVGRLAGGVAHDFNNLLSVIVGYAEMLLEDIDPVHPHHKEIREILDASLRAKSVTRQLLVFGRRQMLDMKQIDINAVINSFEKLLRRVIGEDIEIQIHLMPEKGWVRADISQMEQVLMNLVVNARDAMPDGGEVKIETEAVEIQDAYESGRRGLKPGPYIRLTVTDTGTGMAPDTVGQIFEPFFTTKSHDKGTGLGLATVYGIVKQHGGSIWVYSEPGQGTMFSIYLPRTHHHPPEERIEERRTETASGTAGGTGTVLVVEDDANVRKLTCKLLARQGYEVIESESAEDAVQKAADFEGDIHILLTDVIMPRMKGPEVYRQIAEHRPDIRVLYMSGYTGQVLVRQGVGNTAAQFIQKPFSNKALIGKVNRLMQRS